jgi:hypothetical protein
MWKKKKTYIVFLLQQTKVPEQVSNGLDFKVHTLQKALAVFGVLHLGTLLEQRPARATHEGRVHEKSRSGAVQCASHSQRTEDTRFLASARTATAGAGKSHHEDSPGKRSQSNP